MAELQAASGPTSASRLKPWQFQPGNPGGRPGRRNVQGLLDESIRAAQMLRNRLKEPCLCVRELWKAAKPERREAIFKRSCKTLDQHFARRAFLDDTILAAFQKKRIPDLQHQTGEAPPVAVNIVYGHQVPRVQVVEPLPHA